MADQNRDRAAAGRRAMEEWAARFAESLESMAGEAARVEWTASAATAEAEGDGGGLWWEQGFSPPPDAPLRAGIRNETWASLGARILSAAGIEQPGEAEARSTFL